MHRTISLLATLVLLATACGGGGDDDTTAAAVIIDDGPTAAVAADDTSATDTAEGSDDTDGSSDEELALDFADCMRGNGVDDFPDPTVAGDGSIDFGTNPAAGASADALQGALDICLPIIEGASFLPGTDLDEAQIEANLLAFASCMRDLGHDVRDPDMSLPLTPGPGGPAGIFAGGFDPLDPANAADVQTCQAEIQAGQN